MNRGRGRRFTRTRKFVKNFVTPTQLHRQTVGYSPRGRFDPPAIVATPWNSLVIAFASAAPTAGVTDTTVSNLSVALRSQIGLGLTPAISLRFLRVSVWSGLAPIDVIGSNMALRASNLSQSSNTSTYVWIEDRGTVARPAHMHWSWSVSDRNVVFGSATSADTIIFQVDHHANSAWFCHVHVLWKPSAGDPVPTFRLLSTPTAPRSSHSDTDSVIIDMGDLDLN